MKLLYTIIFFLLVIQVKGQYDPSKIDPKAVKFFESGNQFAYNDQFKEGIEALKKAVAIDNRYEDAWLSMAGMYVELKNYQEAYTQFKSARSIDSIYFKDFSLGYSISLAGLGKFNEALVAANDFNSIPNLKESSRRLAEGRIKTYEFAIEYAAKKSPTDYTFEPRNMGDSINSPVSEYFPTISLDGNHLVFTRRVNGINEDFYESDRLSNGWTKARSLAGNINSNNNEGALNISQDGQWLIFTGCNFQNGFGSCDLFPISRRRDGALLKTWDRILIQNSLNRHPPFHTIKGIYILQVPAPADMAGTIFMFVTGMKTDAGCRRKIWVPTSIRPEMKAGLSFTPTTTHFILLPTDYRVMGARIFFWSEEPQPVNGAYRKIWVTPSIR